MDETEFQKIKDLLAEQLVAAVYSDNPTLEGWKKDVAKQALTADTLEAFKVIMREDVQRRARILKKYYDPPIIQTARRLFSCKGCGTHINKGDSFITLLSFKFCYLCALILTAIDMDNAMALRKAMVDKYADRHLTG